MGAEVIDIFREGEVFREFLPLGKGSGVGQTG